MKPEHVIWFVIEGVDSLIYAITRSALYGAIAALFVIGLSILIGKTIRGADR